MSAAEMSGFAFELQFPNAVWLQKPFSSAKLIELVLNSGHGETGIAV
jgi:hypothetical protein